jgi:hypothetical protein
MALGNNVRAQCSNLARALQGDDGRPRGPWDSPPARMALSNATSAVRQYFDVIGCDTGRRYRIHYGTVTNVHQIDQAGQPVTGLCFVPSGGLVAGDVMLVQKIALETNEQTTLAVANPFKVQAPGRSHPNSSQTRLL